MQDEKDAGWYLRYLVDEIHTTVMATVDGDGSPRTCAVDMMDADGDGLYFLTAKGKSLHRRLANDGRVSVTGIKGDDTMTSVAVTVTGRAVELGPEPIPGLIEKNPYMRDIYPDEKSRSALTAFRITEGSGEWFDLSKAPIERAEFSFGGAGTIREGYRVNGDCIGCKLCYSRCPQKCIDISVKPVVIRQENCLRCGNCYEICPKRAVELVQ